MCSTLINLVGHLKSTLKSFATLTGRVTPCRALYVSVRREGNKGVGTLLGVFDL